MAVFTETELAYLTDGAGLGRVATVGADGTPHVTPVGWKVDADAGVIEVRGNNLPGTKKFRDVKRSGRAALVIDEVLPPWRPRGIEVRGRAVAVAGPDPMIRIYPERIISWGLEGQSGPGRRSVRWNGDRPA